MSPFPLSSRSVRRLPTCRTSRRAAARPSTDRRHAPGLREPASGVGRTTGPVNSAEAEERGRVAFENETAQPARQSRLVDRAQRRLGAPAGSVGMANHTYTRASAVPYLLRSCPTSMIVTRRNLATPQVGDAVGSVVDIGRRACPGLAARADCHCCPSWCRPQRDLRATCSRRHQSGAVVRSPS